MLLKVVYLLTCRALGLAVLVFRGDLAKDAELLVLRHENAVLRRHAGRVRYEPADRAWFGDMRFLIRDRGSNFTRSFDAVFEAVGTRIGRPDQRVHARRLTPGRPPGHLPNPIFERDTFALMANCRCASGPGAGPALMSVRASGDSLLA